MKLPKVLAPGPRVQLMMMRNQGNGGLEVTGHVAPSQPVSSICGQFFLHLHSGGSSAGSGAALLTSVISI